ncbi:MAG TPA: 5-(carboxyamino)imidazole ribonucleotide mutase [Planctomycetota bacterium]|nr:5-(carboxyamino)imidazole ribonucleotide mutase [Planctomycetota bacterium]
MAARPAAGGAAPKVAVLMGSDSDLPVMKLAVEGLKAFGLESEVRVLSAHRSPEATAEFSREAAGRGIGVIICGAGAAAHLAGAVAAQTTLPVIGVPLVSGSLGGLDALLATVQMPPGVPVATVAVGELGARNAAVLAVQILAGADPELAGKLRKHKAEMAAGVAAKDRKVREGLSV